MCSTSPTAPTWPSPSNAPASPAAQVELHEIATDADAAAAGMRGSPTILIDNADPFTPPGTPTGIACRVVPGGDPIPTVEAIRAALS